MPSTTKAMLPLEQITSHINLLHGEKVTFDFDLARLCGVETRVLVQAVKRSIERFPQNFMFQLDGGEREGSRSQIVIGSQRQRDPRRRPYAFAEQGVAMLSSVLRSKQAVHVNIAIMRAFVRLRQMIASHAGLGKKLAALERRYDEQFKVVFEAVRALMAEDEKPGHNRRIGIHP